VRLHLVIACLAACIGKGCFDPGDHLSSGVALARHTDVDGQGPSGGGLVISASGQDDQQG
jgi:hypothetical protein